MVLSFSVLVGDVSIHMRRMFCADFVYVHV
jgi:hypothetical protein